jgi:hypothetical protein
MAVDLRTQDTAAVRRTLERIKEFVDRVAKSKTVYTASAGNCIYNSTQRKDVEKFMAMHKCEGHIREIKYIDLERVNVMRKKMGLGAVRKSLGIDISTRELKSRLVQAGYIKPNSKRKNINQGRDEDIRRLYDNGYTPEMISQELGLNIAASTIRRIARGWQ